MEKILVVDDNSVSLSLAKNMLSDKYTVYAVLSGEQALRFLEKKDADLILLDINMPEFSGYETLKRIRENEHTKSIPIIFLTSDTDPETERKCFELGALDFISKPFQKATLRSRVARTLDLLRLQHDLEGQLLEKTKQIARISLKSMMMIANTVDKKDPLASEHSSNVAWFAVEIAKKLGWSNDEIYNLQNLALVHDIGNIGIPDSIIRKNGPLSTEEYDVIKKHTTYGKNILQDMTVIKKAAEIAETHHEHYDGTGYPNGLKGEDIPIESRIMAVADAFDAMTTDRSYRKKLSTEELLEQFTRGRGTQFDPQLADVALDMINNNHITRSDEDIIREEDFAVESSKLLQKVLQEYTKEIKTESQKDPLTGLWNRSFVSDNVSDFLTDKRHSGCFFMIDIDGFKKVNDTMGHIAGDNLIKDVAECLSSLFRSDDLVCRIGGDEFVIFTKGNSSRSFAASKAEDIILTLDRIVKNPTGDKGISVSIGIALAPYDGNNFTALYTKADKALYHVKENGKHGYHFYSDDSRPLHHTSKSTHIDLENLHRFVTLADQTHGALEVEYDSFKKIYRYLQYAQKNTGRPVMILLLTLTDDEGGTPVGDTLDTAIFRLKAAVYASVSESDVATNYSSSQYLVILPNADENDGYMIAEHIRNEFMSSIGSLKVKFSYDLDTLPLLESTDNTTD